MPGKDVSNDFHCSTDCRNLVYRLDAVRFGAEVKHLEQYRQGSAIYNLLYSSKSLAADEMHRPLRVLQFGFP